MMASSAEEDDHHAEDAQKSDLWQQTLQVIHHSLPISQYFTKIPAVDIFAFIMPSVFIRRFEAFFSKCKNSVHIPAKDLHNKSSPNVPESL